MFRAIMIFGLVAGLAIACTMFPLIAFASDYGGASAATGYLIMLVALSLVFVAVKRHRDGKLGGFIKFAPAFGMGVGISLVAGIVYVVGWEITLALTEYKFADSYAQAAIEAARAKGAAQAELDALAAHLAAFAEMYANPLYRLPMSFSEIFPVGMLVSLVSAGLLRNPRFLPARTPT